METKHFIQGPEEFLIKLGTEKNEEFKKLLKPSEISMLKNVYSLGNRLIEEK